MITFEMFAPIFWAIGIAIAVGLILATLKTKNKPKNKVKSKSKNKTNDNVKLEYSKKKSILTNTELNFYNHLKPISERQNYTLMSKVRISDIIEPKKGAKNYMSLFARISQKHVDFLLCDKRTLEPVLAIELDDSSHDKPSRQNRDKFIDEAYKIAKLPILHTRTTENLEIQISKSLIKA